MSIEISAQRGDLQQFACDLFVLKYAGASYGADRAVAEALGRSVEVEAGQHKVFTTNGRVAATEVLVLGVGPLGQFEYREIEQFGKRAIEIIARERPRATSAALTIHGAGYGLDQLAAIDSLLRGLRSGASTLPHTLNVTIVEREEKRFEALRRLLPVDGANPQKSASPDAEVAVSISDSGQYSKRLFAAMPFSKAFDDHWDYALQPAAHTNGLLIERLDHEAFTGDIVAEIRNRIAKAGAVVALLDEANPNVFLEVGYAWGVGKPTILLLHENAKAPFDVVSHRMIRYGRIKELHDRLCSELRGLRDRAVF